MWNSKIAKRNDITLSVSLYLQLFSEEKKCAHTQNAKYTSTTIFDYYDYLFIYIFLSSLIWVCYEYELLINVTPYKIAYRSLHFFAFYSTSLANWKKKNCFFFQQSICFCPCVIYANLVNSYFRYVWSSERTLRIGNISLHIHMRAHSRSHKW